MRQILSLGSQSETFACTVGRVLVQETNFLSQSSYTDLSDLPF